MAKKPRKPSNKGGNQGKRQFKPILQALLLADYVYKDADTGKNVIAGTFDSMSARKFPTEFSRGTFAFICITEIHGSVPIMLRYVDLSNDEVLMEFGPVSIKASDPLDSIDLAIPVPPIPMPHVGGFAFEVISSGELLGALRITVGLLPDEDEGEQ